LLKSLFGSKSVTEILLFLLVNEECYAHQLNQVLGLAVTPAQKALARLEQGNILTSRYEGKLRIFSFNLACPILSALTSLLKQAYNQLSLEEKKRYYYLPYEHKKEKKQVNNLIQTIWEHLKGVTQMTLIAHVRKERNEPFIRKGKGTVTVEEQGESLLFQENGIWSQDQTHYQNRFRWTWDRAKGMLRLEHLRFGVLHPVFLFDLYAKEGSILQSHTPHLHGEETYFGWMQYKRLFLHLHIRTLGPKKNEKIEYCYL